MFDQKMRVIVCLMEMAKVIYSGTRLILDRISRTPLKSYLYYEMGCFVYISLKG